MSHPSDDVAKKTAEAFAGEETIDTANSTGRDTPADQSNGLRIRCPHCRNSIELIDEADDSLSDINCPSCGSHFSLIDQETNPTKYMPTVKQVGHFELIEQLGVGGFGTVWKARDTELDRAVAVKIPRKNQLDADEMEQFFREARAAAQLKHPNIVSVHEVGRQDDTVFIVSDLVRGVPLDEWLQAQPITARQSAELSVTLCDAVDHAHEAGVIHRDLKPGNILLDDNNDPHVMDFGLAKREAGEITMTVEGRVMGTPAYMSPEQARGDGHAADRRTDIYSLGVILFQLLTGELPFRGTPRMLLHQVLNNEPRSPRSLNDRVPRDLETITLKCMQKDPDRRYESARALGDDLRHFLANEPISARPIGRIERGIRWCRRYPMVAGLSAAVLALCLSVASISTIAAFWINESRGEAITAKDKAVAEQIKALQASQNEETQRKLAEAAAVEAREAETRANQEAKTAAEQRQLAEEAKSAAIQATERAQQEADTAKEVSNFLVDMFEASSSFNLAGFLLSTEANAAEGEQLTAKDILDRGAKRIIEDLSQQPKVQADLLTTIGSVYVGMGLSSEGRPLLERSLQIRRDDFSEDQLELAKTLYQLGFSHFLSGDFGKADRYMRESLSIRIQLLGATDPLVSETKLGRGIILTMYGSDLEEGERLLREALANYEEDPGKNSLEYALGAVALAGNLVFGGKDPLQAQTLIVTATPTLLRNERTAPLARAFQQGIGAQVQALMGRHASAAKIGQNALLKLESSLGASHFATLYLAAAVQRNLANDGQFKQANQVAMSCLLAAQRDGMSDSSAFRYLRKTFILQTFSTVTRLSQEKKNAAAVEVFDSCIESLHELDVFSHDPNEDAIVLDSKSLPYDVSAIPDDCAEYFGLLLVMRGHIAHEMSQFDVSEEFIRSGLTLQKRFLKIDDPILVASVGTLAATLVASEKYSAAEQLYRTYIQDLRQSGRDTSIVLDATIKKYAALLTEQGQYDTAQQLHEERLAIYAELLEQEDVGHAKIQKKFAEIHHDLGHLFEKSVDLVRSAASYDEGLEFDRQARDKKDEVICRHANCLSRVLLEQGSYDRYREVIRESLMDFSDTNNASLANGLAWNCALLPDTVADRGTLVALASVGPNQQPENQNYLHTNAQALYRADQFVEAREQLDMAIQLRARGPEAFDYVLSAMLKIHERDAVGAGLSLNKVRQVIEASEGDLADENWLNVSGANLVQLKLLYEEAKSLIETDANVESVDEVEHEDREPVGPELN